MSPPPEHEHDQEQAQEQEEEEDRLEPGLLKVEIAAFSAIDAIRAQNFGAQRIELNAPDSYEQGGTTPPMDEFTKAMAGLTVPIRIMIRPRGPPADSSPDFIYTDAEFDAMCRSIDEFKQASVLNPCRGDAFVFGIMKLTDAETQKAKNRGYIMIDEARSTRLRDRARPFGCIFHRAFDPIAASPHWKEGIETLLRCGFKGLLTAGGHGSAKDNIPHLEVMTRYVNNRLQLIVGGGLREDNVMTVASRLACYPHCEVWLHSAMVKRTFADDSNDHPPRYDLDYDQLNRFFDRLGLAKPD